MTKILYIIFISIFFLSLGKGYSQISANSVSIEASGFRVQNNCSQYIPSPTGHWEYSTDTVGASFYSVAYPGLTVNGDTISSSGSYRGYTDGFLHNVTLSVLLDTSTGKIVRLTTDDSEGHSTYMGSPYYWVNEGSGMSVSNIHYRTSLTKDSIIVRLDATQLRNTNMSIGSHSSNIYPHSGSGCSASQIVEVLDDAYLRITILGSFTLAVNHNLHIMPLVNIFVDPEFKTVKLSGQLTYQNHTLSCYDILGQKHNLEFRDADNNSATYSIRSLRPGVYFLNDGRETMKFMIGE